MRISAFAIVAMFLLIYLLPLGIRPVAIPDEARYAEVPREMIASGDWIVPRLNGLRYFEKPVMGHWINGISILLFGENAFAIRFPSAMSAGLSALMIFMLVRRFSPEYSEALLAAAIFLSCFEVFGVGVFSVLDSMLAMFITAAMVSFFFAHMEENSLRKKGFLAMFGAFCGLAFLTKGFLAFAVPVVSIVPFMLWEGRWRELFRIAPIPILTAILVALPWGVMIHFREGDFWHYFFWEEHIRRFTADNAQHGEPFWHYIPVIMGGALPWTGLLPAAVSGLGEKGLKTPLRRFGICWFFFPFLFFSASRGKLGTYILPCFPPLAILTASGVLSYFEIGRKKAFTAGAVILAVLPLIVAIALLVNQLTGFPGIRAYGFGETWKWMLALVMLLPWTVLMIIGAKEKDFQRKLALFWAAPLLFMFTAHFIIPEQTRIRKCPGEFLMSHFSEITPETVIVSSDDPLRAVCWFYKRDDVYLFREPGELRYGLSYEDSKHRLLAPGAFRQFINENAGKASVVLIAKAREYKKYGYLIPEPASEHSDGGFVFARFPK